MTENIAVHNLKSKNLQRHNKLLPDEHLRAVFSGAPKSGKTQRLINMLLQPKFLDYDHLILFMPTMTQLCYNILAEGFNAGLSKKEIIHIINHIDDYKEHKDDDLSIEVLNDIIHNALHEREKEEDELGEPIVSENITVDCYTPKEAKELPRAEELDPSGKHVFIVDDCTNRPDMKPIIADYFCNGRHNNISPFYLNQKFNNNDKVIRDNANMLFLFKLPATQLKTVYDDWCTSDVDWDPFISAYNRVLKTPYNFVVIDKTAEDFNRKYREGFQKPLFKESDLSDEVEDTYKLKKKMSKLKL